MSPFKNEVVEIAENRIALLYGKCRRGNYSSWLFQKVIRGVDSLYPLEKLLWMKDFLSVENQSIAADCLSCLCHHGMSLDDVLDVILKRKKDKIFSCRVIELAEFQHNPGILLHYIEEEDGDYVNRVILALKKMKEESYLTSLLFSRNDITVNGVNRVLDSSEKRN